ncbi:hypothetical protein LTS08_002369 [Lithohypha guttulata]|uniref:Uncharacterized protein n=1 Tax=Lithohypha guttulata TaxID=1690604 RepID=A0AAN7YEE5_9EURO|nr:hypothetical protein LTR51_004113 [Lithohypha guttulata]KAK5090722.1 hypothetical protein LTR05_000897 [Lithohypha guttulata]KAK5104479.1 hypothetical protein LTS08_002369 [Lithohypha guttulata]
MPPRAAVNIHNLSFKTSICTSCLRRDFSSTPAPQTRLRRQMFAWLQGPGESFRHPLPNSTNYLSAYNRQGKLLREGEDTPESTEDLRPFPLNKTFVSEAILSEDLRQEIWRRVQVEKKSVRTVSVELGVEMRRVGAVVRLVEVENQMREERKQLALPYARAIHEMLPTTPYSQSKVVRHESINDLPVHPLTDQQLFYPTSESRAFNRTDAGRVFSAATRLPDEQDVAQGGAAKQPWQDIQPEKVGKGKNEMDILKPADARIPHPHLIAFAKDQQELRGNDDEIKNRYTQRLEDDATSRAEARERKFAADEKRKTRVDTGRWQFVVTDVKVSRQGTGITGRGAASPGMRYGVPHEDRKKGQVKIPTRVEV